MDCPACGYVLTDRTLDQLPHRHCELCGGIWVPTLRSMQLWAELHAADEPLPAVPPDATPTEGGACPECGGALERFAYGDDPDVMLQRCGPCRGLWVPGDRQEAARRAWARRTGREERRMVRKADTLHAFRQSPGASAKGGPTIGYTSFDSSGVGAVRRARERDE